MTQVKRVGRTVAVLAVMSLVLGACASGRVATRNVSQPEQLSPLPSSEVASTNLPAIGQSGAVQPNQLPNGQLTTAANGPVQPMNPALTGQPVLGGNQNADNGGFVSFDAVGAVPDAPGRDLTGGLTVQKLLGGWTIVAGPTQCKLNLTQTNKTGTSRYRASTPGCSLTGLNVVASWQLAGSQVQLFDENNDMIAALILSGNRFIGTLAGGQAISMVG